MSYTWYATHVVFAVMPPMSLFGHARAHDHEHPKLNSWYESLHNGKGPCSDGSDAKRVDDVDWKAKTFTIVCALIASELTVQTKL